ncbi:MAG: 4-hydroxythreonine-4-phosphate dehydrogenase PdxA [Bacteroidota bacterium]|nr:4-hydroxythreonine-4-phosphate dehydrogenase PdxA [Candidatus Kapabacteria bacterium]MDW8219230.1 4-hydroxythreonine-4-phosphate dehydrogenase PdxA [Bacteroidota bacterium]
MTILITCGDPNGIGLEVCIKALLQLSSSPAYIADPDIKLVVHPKVLHAYAQALQFPLSYTSWGFRLCGKSYELLPCTHEHTLEFGKATESSGALALEALSRAADELLCRRADAVCTMPVSKYALYRAGASFSGQTEFFAERCGVASPLMILTTSSAQLQAECIPVRVGLATIHIPLKSVAQALTPQLILERLRIFSTALQQDFAITTPRIAVLGLNPHAGEHGALGTEEQECIEPALRAAREQGIQAEGIFPADGFFAYGAYRCFDGILAMYHDQGLIPLKLLAGGSGVNITAGLPIVRTSPDHGTAFSIAGQGIADARSTVEAILLAQAVALNRVHYHRNAAHAAHP